MTKYYTVYFPKTGYSLTPRFPTLAMALGAAAKAGDDAVVQCHMGIQQATVAGWSQARGRHYYDNVVWA